MTGEPWWGGSEGNEQGPGGGGGAWLWSGELLTNIWPIFSYTVQGINRKGRPFFVVVLFGSNSRSPLAIAVSVAC
jgi:hypothetical protein